MHVFIAFQAGQLCRPRGWATRSGAAGRSPRWPGPGSDAPKGGPGGSRDWTVRGVGLPGPRRRPVHSAGGPVSPIIDGDTGFHIIRVTRRDPVILKSFAEAQAEIKKKIVQQRVDKQLGDYLASCRPAPRSGRFSIRPPPPPKPRRPTRRCGGKRRKRVPSPFGRGPR